MFDIFYFIALNMYVELQASVFLIAITCSYLFICIAFWKDWLESYTDLVWSICSSNALSTHRTFRLLSSVCLSIVTYLIHRQRYSAHTNIYTAQCRALQSTHTHTHILSFRNVSRTKCQTSGIYHNSAHNIQQKSRIIFITTTYNNSIYIWFHRFFLLICFLYLVIVNWIECGVLCMAWPAAIVVVDETHTDTVRRFENILLQFAMRTPNKLRKCRVWSRVCVRGCRVFWRRLLPTEYGRLYCLENWYFIVWILLFNS